MSEDSNYDYEELGFKSGLEIHQQLDTRKLFCNCPSMLRKDEPDFIIKRKLHAVAGESGEIDIAAKYEAEQDREFIYQAYHSNTCLVELDEEPPHLLNSKSLKIAIQIALLLNCKILPITQIMRKTVVNGSNTSGFQRTVLIARDGYIETEQGKISIDSIALEEDSAREINKEGKIVTFRLDRLGIPLIEIVTSPDIKNSEQVKEVALHIGDVLRSSSVKRGIGTIRQDVNVSIGKGNRVEIKGFQNPAMMIKTVDNEIKRQLNLVEKKKKVKNEVRNALPSGETKFLRPMPGASRMYPETDLPLLRISRELINEVKKTLPKLRSDEEKELRKEGLSEEMIKILFKQNKLPEFKELWSIINKPQLVAKVLLIFPSEIASREKKPLSKINGILNKDVLAHILENVKKKKIFEGDIKHVMEKIVKGEGADKAVKLEKHDSHEIEEKIMKIIKEKPNLSANAYMGLVMKEFKGKVSGNEAMEIIKKHVK